MVKRTIETYECDICGLEGERYTIGFPEGVLALDRCEKHDQVIISLREEKGTWSTPAATTRSVFRVSSTEEIERQRRAKKGEGPPSHTNGVSSPGLQQRVMDDGLQLES